MWLTSCARGHAEAKELHHGAEDRPTLAAAEGNGFHGSNLFMLPPSALTACPGHRQCARDGAGSGSGQEAYKEDGWRRHRLTWALWLLELGAGPEQESGQSYVCI